MLTVNEVSAYSKDRVIGILSTGVNTMTVQTVISGLAHEAIAKKKGLNWEEETSNYVNSTMEFQIERATEVAEELKTDIKGYMRLALTIYAQYIADWFVNEILKKVAD